MANTYVPGVCNIGPAEIQQRRNTGIAGGSIAAAGLLLALATGAPKPLRALIALPAAMGATGFLQARLHFCAGFGMRGVFNMGESLGRQDTVEEAEFRRLDQRKALAIVAGSVGAGAAVGAASLLLP